MNIRTIVLCCFIVTGHVLSASAMTRDEAVAAFVDGNAFYRQGRYEQAKKEYLSILQQGWSSAPVYYNLANTFTKLNEKGEAILYYQLARRLSPRDSDLNYNERYVRSRLTGQEGAVNVPPVWQFLEDMAARFTQKELFWAAAVLIQALFLVIVLAVGGRWSRRLTWGIQSIIVLFFGLTVLLLSIKSEAFDAAAIVIDDTHAKFEPREQATDHYPLHEGMPVSVIQEEGRWMKVRRFDDKLGWVPSEHLGVLDRHMFGESLVQSE